jgi:F-type H+-transporting ATPase subunit b
VRIDWFTFVAQVLNFLILVVLLRKFLYRPVLGVIEERRADIRRRVEEAEAEQERARLATEAAREREATLERERNERLHDVQVEAAAVRSDLLKEARAEAAEMRRTWAREVEREREAFLDELREGTRRQVYGAVRAALDELADASLERRAMDVLLSRLDAMDDVDRDALREAALRSDEPLLVRSRFELPESERRRIKDALAQLAPPDTPIRFEIEPEIGWGLELRAGDTKVGWSVESYVTELEERMEELLRGRIEAHERTDAALVELAPEESPAPDDQAGAS